MIKRIFVTLYFLLISASAVLSSSPASSSLSSPVGKLSGGSTTTESTILQLGDPRLRNPFSRKVRPKDVRDIHSNPFLLDVRDRLHAALAEFQSKHGYGRAIAAPQIGADLKMIAMKLSDAEPAITLYNPEIIAASPEQVTLWDDCFSFNDVLVRISRHKCVTVKFIDDRGEEKIWECTDVALSELLQHEIDHLSGVLAVDHALPPIMECETVLCESIVKRDDWEKHKDSYNLFVDFVPAH